MRRHKAERGWSIHMLTGRHIDRRPLLLGRTWMPDCTLDVVPFVRQWPAWFKTRREARAIAKALTQKYDYMKPLNWQFRAVRIAIQVTEP